MFGGCGAVRGGGVSPLPRSKARPLGGWVCGGFQGGCEGVYGWAKVSCSGGGRRFVGGGGFQGGCGWGAVGCGSECSGECGGSLWVGGGLWVGVFPRCGGVYGVRGGGRLGAGVSVRASARWFMGGGCRCVCGGVRGRARGFQGGWGGSLWVGGGLWVGVFPRCGGGFTGWRGGGVRGGGRLGAGVSVRASARWFVGGRWVWECLWVGEGELFGGWGVEGCGVKAGVGVHVRRVWGGEGWGCISPAPLQGKAAWRLGAGVSVRASAGAVYGWAVVYGWGCFQGAGGFTG